MLAKNNKSSPEYLLLLYPTSSLLHIMACSSEDQLENVVEDVEAACSVGEELEGLAVVHGSLLIIDLGNNKSAK